MYDFSMERGNNFKSRLLKIIEDKGMNQYQLAKAIGAKANTVNNWFKDRAQCPRDKYLKRIAEHFNVSPAWLRYGDKEYAPSTNDEVQRIAEKLEEYGKEHPENLKKLDQIIDICIGSGVDFRQDTAIPEKLQKKKEKGILRRTA